jgi:hypothetical protein
MESSRMIMESVACNNVANSMMTIFKLRFIFQLKMASCSGAIYNPHLVYFHNSAHIVDLKPGNQKETSTQFLKVILGDSKSCDKK